MKTGRYLFLEEHIPEKARYPVIDAHNHLWGRGDARVVVSTMDAVGIAAFCDLTANALVTFTGDGYKVQGSSINEFFNTYSLPFPGRFYCFTLSSFARSPEKPLYADAGAFVESAVSTLRDHVNKGARGLKILKEFGLSFRNARGGLLCIDDPCFSSLWSEAGKLGVPVLIHQSDPYGFFQPDTPENEHHETLKKYPAWKFSGPEYPGKDELIQRRDRIIQRHRDTTFILPHAANFPENLPSVARLLDDNRNVYIDLSARLDELGRQPYTAREFCISYQDRIVFGSDMPADIDTSQAMYRTYFRFLETFDEGFYSPDYDGTFKTHRWPICGIGLPDDVLKKIYYKNILKIIPGLKEELVSSLPD